MAEGSAVISAQPRQAMSDEAIDQALRALAQAAEYLLAEHAAAVRLQEELSQKGERRLEQLKAQGQTSGALILDPQESLRAQREFIAEQVADQHERAVALFVSWWADVVACAAVAVLAGVPLRPARVVAADPHTRMRAEDLAALAPIPNNQCELAEGMDGDPPGGGDAPGSAMVGRGDFAAELGLRITRTAEGEPMLAEDEWPEARRRRLWGRAWLDHQMPLLPTTAELLRVMTEVGTPGETVTAIFDAAHAVDMALAAKIHCRALDRQLEKAEEPEAVDRLDAEFSVWGRAGDELPAALAAYARVLADHLPVLRAARAGHCEGVAGRPCPVSSNLVQA
ncbi:hypothetical protein [Streptosporangium sp. CA-115845]|uniref:hypothetical protein n=1 Tax=Streptosporangium sp. CA-115845 TaxID=3240071 RepID=UPI003D94D26E